jgi:hypothetical protein
VIGDKKSSRITHHALHITFSMEHSNAYLLISDYVLDLLPAETRQLMEFHAAGCPDCRQAIQRERQVGQVVRDTLLRLPRPASGRLNQLRPVYQRPRPFFSAPRQLAALALMVCLLLGTVGLNQAAHSQPNWPLQSPTVLVATETATATTAPTSTAMITEDLGPATAEVNPVATIAHHSAPSPAAGPAAGPNLTVTPDATMIIYSH